MSLEALITEIATSHPVATRAQRVTGITHRVGDAKNTAEAAADSAANANAEASRANTAVLEAAATAQQAGEDARQAGADVLDTIRRIEDGSLKTYLNLTDYISQGKLAGQITGVYIADLAVSRAKIADAAINSAKIANLAVNSQHVNEITANKITSGDITASLVSITGRLEAGGGGVRLDGMGLALSPVEDAGSAPTDRAGRKITNLGANKWTHLQVFESSGVRGMATRADGASGGANGRVELIATAAGDSTASSTARVRVTAGGGGGNVLVEGNVLATQSVTSQSRIGPDTTGTYARQNYVPPFNITSGSNPAVITHSYGSAPDFVHVQANVNNWQTIAGNGNNWNVRVDNVDLRIHNQTGSTHSVRASIMNGS